jgi:hypothetical protein
VWLQQAEQQDDCPWQLPQHFAPDLPPPVTAKAEKASREVAAIVRVFVFTENFLSV